MKELYIIDASAYLYRAYFAIQNMTNQEGQSTNALYGFISSFLKLLADKNPEYVIAAFDGPKSWQSRTRLYADYKANRRVQPPDLFHQIDWAREFCKLFGLPLLDIPEVEADDTIASVARLAESEGFKVFICSEDKDLGQIVNSNIKLLYTRQDNRILGPAEVEEKFGVKPQQIIDYLAIVGDSSDNVPGIPGFGPKTAVDLLKKWETLEGVYKHADNLTDKKKATLDASKEQAFLSRELVTLNEHVDIPKEMEFYKLSSTNEEKLKEFYLSKQFLKFTKTLEEKREDPETNTYTLIQTEEQFLSLLGRLNAQKELAFDTETTSEEPMLAEMVGIGFCIEPGSSFYVPLNGEIKRTLIIEELRSLFAKEQILFIGHNVKYDMHVLMNEGIEPPKRSFDTIIASYILSAQQRQHSLDALSLELFGKVKIPITDLIGKGQKQISMKEVPLEKVATYCGEDVDYTYRLKLSFQEALQSRGLEELFHNLEMPLLYLLLKMERRGIFVDKEYLKELSAQVAVELEKESAHIFKEAGEEFNLNSPKQLSEILYEKLKIPAPKKTATGFSTSADVLEELEESYPIVKHILAYRAHEKLRSTYIDSLPDSINPKTGRIHCTFNQSVAATGRLSSQHPNLQNIPVRSELGLKIRKAFRPEDPKNCFLSADYSQIELRLMAHLSEDPELIHAFQKGEDIHRYTASRVFDVLPDLVTSEMRFHAKAVNFGILYGQGKFGLAKQLGITQKAAGDFIERYFKRFKRVKEYIDEVIRKAHKEGKAVTMSGRERLLPEISSKNQQLRAQAERLAVNTPLQGSAADLIKLAMLRVEALFKKEHLEGLMILQIHDELVFELPESLVEQVKPLVKQGMEEVWKLKVPLIVDLSIGKNWAEC